MNELKNQLNFPIPICPTVKRVAMKEQFSVIRHTFASCNELTNIAKRQSIEKVEPCGHRNVSVILRIIIVLRHVGILPQRAVSCG